MQDPAALRLTLSLAPDAENIAAAMDVMVKAFPPEYGEAWSVGQLSSMMYLPGAMLVVGRTDAGPIGFALLRSIAGEAELLLLAVHPDHRGYGHGSRLLDRCMTESEGSGAEALFLEVRYGNPAISLYRKAGFLQYNVRKDYYSGSNGMKYDALSFKVILGQV